MRHRSRWIAAILIAAGLALPGCMKSADDAASDESGGARVVTLHRTGVKQVTLTQQASNRLGIRTVTVRESTVTPPEGGRSVTRKVIPYSAVVYDVNGHASVYTMTEPLTFVRTSVAIDYIDGGVVVLSSGPPLGTAVVTTGVDELYGTEFGVGQE
jgi:hypothetical protein